MFRHKLYQLREERDMKPETFASLVSALLYEKRLASILTSQGFCLSPFLVRKSDSWDSDFTLCIAC